MVTADSSIPSWRSGHAVRLGGELKLVVLAGAGSRTGDGERAFGAMARYLQRSAPAKLKPELLEGSYAGAYLGERWVPRPYGAADTRASLAAGAEAFAGSLDWYRTALPPQTRFCVLGYSLGGVVALDGATLAVARDRAGWRGRLAAVATFSSPLRGTEAELFLRWAWVGTSDLQGLGAAGAELGERWKSSEEQTRLERRILFLRSEGAQVLTFADPDDAVVRPQEAIVLEAPEERTHLLVRAVVGGSANLGHGGLLQEPSVWRRISSSLGLSSAPVQPTAPPSSIEQELQQMKERLRADGRIR